MSDKISTTNTNMPDTNRKMLFNPGFKKIMLLFAVFTGLMLIYLTPLREVLTKVGKVADTIEKTGPAAPIVAILGITALVAIGCPRLLLCPIAGIAFGFWQGLAIAQLGTVLGSYIEFLFARWCGRDYVLRHHPRFEKAAGLFNNSGFASIMVMRQLPIASYLTSMFLAFTRVKHADYILGTFLGTLPQAIPATLIGSTAAHESLKRSIAYLSIAMLVLFLTWIAVSIVARHLNMDIRKILTYIAGGYKRRNNED